MDMKRPRLGVNIDHVATLRQQREESYPDMVRAAEMALDHGADQITLHLREDRRHVQDADMERVKEVTSLRGKGLNFEMGCAPDIVAKALAVDPSWICLVPERREERTTEGGLDLLNQETFRRVQETIGQLRQGTKSRVSLFLQAEPAVLARAMTLEVEAVEIHTGGYAMDFSRGESLQRHLALFQQAARQLEEGGVGCHAGHGLTRDSLVPLVAGGFFAEYNIGHWIISEAVFSGLGAVIAEIRGLCSRGKNQKNQGGDVKE